MTADGWLLNDATRNRIRAEAQRAALGGHPLMGIVSGYDPKQYAAKVTLMPEGAFPEQEGDEFETDWIPISAHMLGNGIGIFAPPPIGGQVHVKFIDGEVGSAVIDGAVYDLNNQPLPADTNGAGVPAGEIWIVGTNNNRMTLANAGDSLTLKHHLGSTIVVDGTADSGNDAVTITHHSGSTVVMDKDGNVMLTTKSGSAHTINAPSGKITLTAAPGQITANGVQIGG